MKAALLLALAACATTGRGGAPACWETAADFALPPAATLRGGQANITKLLETTQAQECADHDPVSAATWQSKCSAAFQQVMSEHCRPQVDAHCESKCADADSRALCLGQNRHGLEDACARGALDGFMQTLRFCKGLTLQGNNTFAVPMTSTPTCP